MEDSASALHLKPLLTTVGTKHRLTAITIDPQLSLISEDTKYDVVYAGTEDGRVIKLFYYTDKNDTLKTAIISDVQVLPPGTPIKELLIARETENLIVVSNIVVTTPMHYCKNLSTCNDCVRDIHCTWHVENHECVPVDYVKSKEDVSPKKIKNYLQDVKGTLKDYCKMFGDAGNRIDDVPTVIQSQSRGTVSAVGRAPHSRGFPHDNEITVTSIDDHDLPDIIMTSNGNIGAPWRGEQVEANNINTYTSQTMASCIVTTSFVSLVIGILIGFFLSRKCYRAPFFGADQRNHLSW